MPTAYKWDFSPRFRSRAFGWRGTSKAIERLNEALAEIGGVARSDAALAAEGAVLLLEKLSPAIRDIDSSSGSLGTAAGRAVETLVPLIAGAAVPTAVRAKWLERLFDALQDDDPPYIERLGSHWGTLCADPALASRWAVELLPIVRNVMAERRNGAYAYTQLGPACLSALFHAGRYDELLELLALDPKPFWHDQQWAARVMALRGDVDGAIAFVESLRSAWAPDTALSAIAEQLLLDAGRLDDAYARYGIAANRAHTHIATFRAIVKRYPRIEPARILGDLIASTPGEEGKWFATAKTLKQYDLALGLARRSDVDPKTLVRAARDHVKSRPAFALEVALLALHAMARGLGYELTAADVRDARAHAAAAAETLAVPVAVPVAERIAERIADSVAGEGASARWVRQCLVAVNT